MSRRSKYLAGQNVKGQNFRKVKISGGSQCLEGKKCLEGPNVWKDKMYERLNVWTTAVMTVEMTTVMTAAMFSAMRSATKADMTAAMSAAMTAVITVAIKAVMTDVTSMSN